MMGSLSQRISSAPPWTAAVHRVQAAHAVGPSASLRAQSTPQNPAHPSEPSAPPGAQDPFSLCFASRSAPWPPAPVEPLL